MKNYKKYISISLLAICILGIGVLYHYRHPLYLQYQKTVLNSEFACPENQTLDKDTAYIYRFGKFYMDNYPQMKLSDLITIRYNQLIQHNCTKTLANIANDNAGNATTSADTGDTTLGKFRQSSSNIPVK